MHTVHVILLAILTLASEKIYAASPSEVFEQVSGSVVVVKMYNAEGKSTALGSGVILSRGEVATNCHVVENAVRIGVRHGGREFEARLHYSDWDRDVCELTVPGLDISAVKLGTTKSLKVGSRVYAIGAPKGLELTLSEGIVSSLREGEGGRYIQTTAAISPGSSGGGLFDAEGRLVGLTTFYLTEAQNLNFAVPVEWITELPQRNQTKAVKSSDSYTHWLNKAAEFESRKDWKGLESHARHRLTSKPDDAVAWLFLSKTYIEQGQDAKAIKALERYLRIHPGNDSAWVVLGRLYGKQDQHAKALVAFQQALRINPDNASAWLNMGLDYVTQNQPAKAIESLHQVLRINPDSVDARHYLGMAYIQQGNSAMAIESLQEVLRINPDHADAWYYLGMAYSQDGNRTKVSEVYRRLKQLNQEQAEDFFQKVVLP